MSKALNAADKMHEGAKDFLQECNQMSNQAIWQGGGWEVGVGMR